MFTRVITNQYVKDLVKEARRVKYTVTKDSVGYTILDGEHLVLSAFRINRVQWIARFSNVYWQQPVI